MSSNLFNLNFNLNKYTLIFSKLLRPSTFTKFSPNRNTHIVPNNILFNNSNIHFPQFSPMYTNFNTTCSPYTCLTSKRYYTPQRHIDWVGIKKRWRVKQVLQSKKKHKNHPRVAMRFKLTRFGWERLQSGRNSKKFNMSRQKYKNKMRVKYVSRSDLKKLDRQMPGYRLRIRDPPINNNPNIRKARVAINNYFG